jgi:8-oxo-dGTP diphosphatase
MIEKNTFNVINDFGGAKAMLFIGSNIVAIRRDNNTNVFPLMMDIPGGGREGEESPFDTLKREVFEELGIHLTKEDIIFSKRWPSMDNPSVETYFMVSKPLSVTKSDICFGDEGLGYFLMTPTEYLSLKDAIPAQKDRIKDYLSQI